MKKNRSYMFRSEKKKKKSVAVITLITISSLLSLSALVWIWMNDWNVEKSYNRIAVAITSFNEQENPEPDESDELERDENLDDEDETDVDLKEDDEIDQETPDVNKAVEYIEGQELPVEPTYIDGILIANKKHPLPSTFEPGESKEAREAFNEMRAAALLEDIHLVAFSTYRSFDYQTELYNRYVEKDGVEEADRYSARPGYSEHQTGLAFDIGEVNKEEHWVASTFAETPGGKWLAKNAYIYGFIMRYPKGKEHITGYMYESWHFRFVGKEIAKDIYENNSTLEEYLEI